MATADRAAPTAASVLDDLALAAELVQSAGQLALEMRRGVLIVDQKTSISDLVSDADKAAELLIVNRLAEVRPDDGLIGEEGAFREGQRKWVIDPVDGTYNFVAGLPLWCSAVALIDGDDLVLGAIYQPTTNELWLGGPGVPTTLNGVPVQPLADQGLAEVSISTYLHPARLSRPELLEPLLRTISRAAVLRIIGSGSIELAAVASSRLGVWVHADTLPWDWLPGAALIQGAGGVTDVFENDGVRWHLAGPATAVAEVKQSLLAQS